MHAQHYRLKVNCNLKVMLIPQKQIKAQELKTFQGHWPDVQNGQIWAICLGYDHLGQQWKLFKTCI